MKVAGFAVCLFAAAFAVHWLLWRVWVPRRQFFWLLIIFLALLPIGLACAHWLPGLHRFAPKGFWEHLHVAVFHVAVSLGYIVTYSALEEDSPTLTLVAFLGDAGGRGRSREELDGLFDNDSIAGSRFQALLASNLVERAGDGYALTARGRSWARVFGAFRGLYRLERGG